MLKKLFMMVLVFVLLMSFVPVGGYAEAATPTPTIKTTKELTKYLKTKFGKIKTKLITLDVRDNIQVIESDDIHSCFDIAIVVDWSAIESDYYKIMDSRKYTQDQKDTFEESLKWYQRRIATAVMKIFPKKKIRGGFLDYGYVYPNIKEDYYEGAVFGWKNYEYTDDGLFPAYEDTKVSKFNWCSFSDIGDPFDQVGLY